MSNKRGRDFISIGDKVTESQRFGNIACFCEYVRRKAAHRKGIILLKDLMEYLGDTNMLVKYRNLGWNARKNGKKNYTLKRFSETFSRIEASGLLTAGEIDFWRSCIYGSNSVITEMGREIDPREESKEGSPEQTELPLTTDQLYQSRPGCTYQPRHECIDAEQVQDQVKDLDQQIKVVRHHQAEIWAVKDEIIKRLEAVEDHQEDLMARVDGIAYRHGQIINKLHRDLSDEMVFVGQSEEVGTK